MLERDWRWCRRGSDRRRGRGCGCGCGRAVRIGVRERGEDWGERGETDREMREKEE